MSNYIVRFYLDNEYEVVDEFDGAVVYRGTIVEVNAWLDLQAKGYDL